MLLKFLTTFFKKSLGTLTIGDHEVYRLLDVSEYISENIRPNKNL